MLLDVDKIKLRFEKKIDRLIKELNVYILMNSLQGKVKEKKYEGQNIEENVEENR